MSAITLLMSLLVAWTLCLTVASAKHLGDEKTIESPPVASSSKKSEVAAQMDYGNSVQLAECLALQDLICKTQTSNSTTSGVQTSVAETRTPHAARQLSQSLVLSQSLASVVAQLQTYFTQMQPLFVAAIAFAAFLTPAQVTLLSDISTGGQTLLYTSMPAAVAMLATNPTLNPVQILQVKTVLQQGVSLNANIQLAIDLLAAMMNLSPAQIQVVKDMSALNTGYYTTMLDIFSDPINQPSPTAAQTLALQTSLDAVTSLVITAGSQFGSVTPPTSTATTSSTTASPLPILAQLLQDADVLWQQSVSVLVPMVASANVQSLTLTEAAQVEALLNTMQGLQVAMQNVIAMVSTNPTLTPAQLQQVKDTVALKITTLSSIECDFRKMAPKLNLNAGQVQAIIDVSDEGIDLFSALLPFVSTPGVNPTFSPLQLERLHNVFAHAEGVVAAAGSALTSTTTATTATPFTTTSSGHTHQTTTRHHSTNHYRPPPNGGNNHHQQHQHVELTPFEKYLISARIQGIVVELQALLNVFRTPSAARSTDAAQPVAVIERLLTLRTRQAEIDERLRTMSAQEREELDRKLEVAQGRLRKLVSDRSELAQYLTKTKGRHLPLTVLLNKMADDLGAFL